MIRITARCDQTCHHSPLGRGTLHQWQAYLLRGKYKEDHNLTIISSFQDYIFSGHTMTLTMAYLAIKQCDKSGECWTLNNYCIADSPRRFVALHWLSFLISLTGICGLVVARGHYSIDVILAYFVTTRLWWIYHAMATSQKFKKRSDDNFLSQAWWFWIFHYFEKNVPCNLPRRYSIFLPTTVKDCLTSTRDSCKTGCRSDEGDLIESQGREKEENRRNVV